MNDLADRLARLSPEKRELVLQQLRERGVIAEAQPPASPIVPTAREGRLPLSFSQERLWFLEHLEPTGSAYQIPVVLHLSGPLNIPALSAGIDAVVRRHEILRTHFISIGGCAAQVIAPARPVELPLIDLDEIGAQARPSWVNRLLQTEAAKPFDLSGRLLLRALLLRWEAGEHLLFLSMHHIVSDGWSVSVLLRELGAFYRAQLEGRTAALPALPIQYVDFAVWQRNFLQGEVLAEQIRYWKEQLKGAPAGLDLPTDHPRPPVQSYRGQKMAFALPADLTAGLNRLSRQEGTTLFMTLLAAFKVLLYRYTAQGDISVGMPIANRRFKELEGLIGFFTNTLVLRTQVAENQPFRELLARIRETALGAYAHQDLPFERLVEELQPQRDLSRSPLFQVLFMLQNMPWTDLALPGIRARVADIDLGNAKFDLTLSLWTDADHLEGWVEYNVDLFEEASIAGLIGHFKILLSGIVADAGQAVGALPLLSRSEERQLLEQWNDTRKEYPRDACVHELFADMALKTPDRVAVVYEDRCLSYAELNRRADRLAQELLIQGIGPEHFVGICLERSPEMIIGLLGILKAGGVYVPLDPTYPRERLAFILQDVRPAVILTQTSLQDLLPPAPAARLCLPQDEFFPVSGTGSAPVVAADNLAYVSYTSGSTGIPKGVSISHRNVVRLVRNTNYAELDEDQIFLQLAPLMFDASTLELWGSLLNGARLVLFPARLPALEELGAVLENEQVSLLWLTAGLFHQVVEQVLPRLRKVKQLLAGGDVLSVEHVRLALRNLPESRVINGYGPTENTTFTCCCVMTGAEQVGTTVAIGRPIAQTRVYILDRRMQPVPIGVGGELYTGGDGLARGYWGSPDLTAERFVPDPFGPEPGGRLYRTGDLARRLADGHIAFLGRTDFQVKIRGFRVELGEIETVLTRHARVREAIVLAREDSPGDKRLTAYVVPVDGDAPPDSADLRTHLKTSLPNYMIPAVFLILPALPLTPSGKVDRRALPRPDRTPPESETEYAAPRTVLEQELTRVWAEVLQVEQIGIHDNFFELGGHSLLAMRLLARIRDIFSIDLPLRTVFETPSVSTMSAKIRESRAGDGEEALMNWPRVVPSPADRYEPFPLTDIQQAYWIGRGGDFELGNVATHGYGEYECRELDLKSFETAWRKLIERHEMLRTIFSADGRQRILKEVPDYCIRTLDLRNRAPAEAAVELRNIRERMSHEVLDAARWPLFEMLAVYLDDHRLRLHMSSDALIGDAWSGQIMWRELEVYYRDPEAALPALELSFRDYVLAQEALRQTPAYAKALAHWRGRASTLAPAPELPLAQNPGSLKQPRFKRCSGTLAAAAWSRLKIRAARCGLTGSVILLAAFSEVLAVWSKRPRFTINLTLFNRLPLHPQVNAIVGDFTSLTLLEVDHRAEGTFTDRARRIRQQLWEDLDHRLVSGVQVLRELARLQNGPPRALMPVVFTSTLVHGAGADPIAATGSSADLDNLLQPIYQISQTPQVWLDHQVREQSGMLCYNWDVLEEIFPAGLPEAMFAAYHRLLEQLADQEETWNRSTAELVPLPPEQREQRAAVNGTAGPVSPDLLQTLFAKQVPARGSQPAVITAGRTWSYAELFGLCNRIGRGLRDKQVQPNTLVAVVMEKGWEQVAAALGILNAGAAYLPIDPQLPEERLQYLLKQGEVRWALTQSWLETKIAWPEGVEPLSITPEAFKELSPEPLPSAQNPKDLAYVIFTSGSTGEPKGVMIDHQGAVNTILDMNSRFEVKPADRVLGLSALNFDLSVYDLFGMLAAGATLVLPDADKGRDPGHWLELMEKQRVTLWNTVPALMEMLVEYVSGSTQSLPESLRLAFLSGDWIPLTLPERIRQVAGQTIAIYSGGGATEAAIWSILYPIKEVDPSWTGIPYGKPLANQRFEVLDEQLNPRPVWVPGELYIGGIGLARGYWKDEEKTRRSFILHPRSGERLYRTGDLGRYRPDGNIEFLGREDQQVKIQGYRIELGEIEAVLLQHPRVKAGVVTVTGEARGDKRLVGWFVPDRAQSPFPATPPAALGDYQPSGAQDLILDPLERFRFKLAHPGLRKTEDRSDRFVFTQPVLDETAIRRYASRRSYRRFASAPMPREQLGRLLSCLWQTHLDGIPLPKYLYGSAGSLYPVQVYLYIKPGRVRGLAAGTYYYHPAEHSLVRISAETPLERKQYAPGNQEMFDAAAFCLFLAARLEAIRPLYGEWSRDFCLLEAGLITQLLEMSAAEQGLGLCQIGGFDFDPIRPWFDLEPDHLYLHQLIGGALTENAAGLEALQEETADLRLLQELLEKQSAHQTATVPDRPEPSGSEDGLEEELKQWMRRKLPEYMVPATLIRLEALPLTPNGKVDRKALPRPEPPVRLEEKAAPAPQSRLEQELAQIWQEVLHVERVGVQDNFFDLGGTSIHIIRIHRIMAERMGWKHSVIKLFEHPSIQSLARYLGANRAEADALARYSDRGEARRKRRQRHA